MTDDSADVPALTFPTYGKVRWGGMALDCNDLPEMVLFYGAMLDLPVLMSGDEFALLGRPGQLGLAFVRIEGYQAPTWPDPAVPKQSHLDFGVDDLDEAQAELVALGARVASVQPQPDRWRVLLDPAGHPFCISTAF
jgi:catechol 2,3-dioxygenase-like lactoylglutathione lyase family enzyme